MSAIRSSHSSTSRSSSSRHGTSGSSFCDLLLLSIMRLYYGLTGFLTSQPAANTQAVANFHRSAAVTAGDDGGKSDDKGQRSDSSTAFTGAEPSWLPDCTTTAADVGSDTPRPHAVSSQSRQEGTHDDDSYLPSLADTVGARNALQPRVGVEPVGKMGAGNTETGSGRGRAGNGGLRQQQRWRHSRRTLAAAAANVSDGARGTSILVAGNGTAEVYLVLAGTAADPADRYGINLSYESLAAAGLQAALLSVLPRTLTLLDSSGVVTVTWNNESAQPVLDGVNSYFELHIPATNLDTEEGFGCLVYNTTSNLLHTAAGNITSLPTAAGAVVPPPASYNATTQMLVCRLVSAGGSYVVAQEQQQQQQQAALSSGGNGNTSNSNTINTGGEGVGSGGGGSKRRDASLAELVTASVVGAVMAIPISALVVTLWVLRSRRRRKEAAEAEALALARAAERQQHHQHHYKQQQQQLQQPSTRHMASVPYIAVHPVN
ncbi:hypothetical protein VOLCADRAFT_94041 [Volvox carteri f. nagariensis]|uniref:Uncharacterized protein n=1 Tax=Volvox carteri f. nagariensis TaxID=3068 RepID=D8U3R9_VOLCA|nr:uncharacterized protein VOLCADRAFT_94041 [Volvox carteri f. nagariensis]EFJ45658.1 hypothetical protein VOLCADRAFT_94041 [Volvox carteri f. nagariensis]|eukprot:XP_002953348.1 hypothetical protein VOLCADRAFT_94041 [Volvox carteri f. nagariensis]